LKNLFRDKNGYTLGDLQAIVLTLVIVGVLFGVGMYTTAQFTTQINASQADGVAVIAIRNATRGLADLATWVPLIAVVIAAALIIGIVVRSFQGAGAV